MSLVVVLWRLMVFIAGGWLVASTLRSAIVNFVLPRSAPNWMVRAVFRSMRKLFLLIMNVRRLEAYEDRDRVMALYAPISVLVLLPVWLVMILFGFTGMFWSIGVEPLERAFKLSGSSLLTLGFENVSDIPSDILAFAEATIGLILTALLISYLPTMYGAFQRREAAVSMLDVRAGSPPSAVEMLLRFQRIAALDQLPAFWREWEVWFNEVEESHTSLAALPFYRSPRPERSWITAAGTVLDAAALTAAVVDVPRSREAGLCLRAGFLALSRIADFYQIPYPRQPTFPEQPISIEREEFDQAYDQLVAGGVPLLADRDQAWRDYAGWRVNYDIPLLVLAELVMAPAAPWVSDRAVPRQYMPFQRLAQWSRFKQ